MNIFHIDIIIFEASSVSHLPAAAQKSKTYATGIPLGDDLPVKTVQRWKGSPASHLLVAYELYMHLINSSYKDPSLGLTYVTFPDNVQFRPIPWFAAQ
jgi:hypothetical protein